MVVLAAPADGVADTPRRPDARPGVPRAAGPRSRPPRNRGFRTPFSELYHAGSLRLPALTDLRRDLSIASIDSIKYLVVWKRLKGKWLLHRDIWNATT